MRNAVLLVCAAVVGGAAFELPSALGWPYAVAISIFWGAPLLLGAIFGLGFGQRARDVAVAAMVPTFVAQAAREIHAPSSMGPFAFLIILFWGLLVYEAVFFGTWLKAKLKRDVGS